MGRRQGGFPARLQMFLLLLLNLHIVSSTTSEESKTIDCKAERNNQFDTQRAKMLFKNLGLTAGLVHWPTEADVTKLPKYDKCTAGTGLSDTCINGTIGVHYYFDKEGVKQGIVITDLSRAWKCGSGNKCTCAEEGAEAEDIGEGENKEKRCIQKGKVDKGKECIHDMECKNKNLVCVYHPGADNKDIANCGEIDDLRRFCGHSNIMLPTMALYFPAIIVPVSYFTLFK